MPPIDRTDDKLPPLPPQPANVKLPDDAHLLEQGLREHHPELIFHRHGTEFALCQHPRTKQYVHVPHDNIRRKQGRLIEVMPGPGGLAALTAENAALKERLARLEELVRVAAPAPQPGPDVESLVRRLSQLEAQLGVTDEAK